MCNIPEQNADRNIEAGGQSNPLPIDNENVPGSVPAAVITTGSGEGQEHSGDNADQPHDAANTPATPQPQLFAVIDSRRHAVPFEDLTDEPRRLQFKQRCQQADEPVAFQATEFFMLAAAVRYLLLKFVKELGDQARLQIGDDQEQYPNIFEAIVAAFPAAVSTDAQTAAKQASIEGAALFLAENDWPAAANTIADSLTEIGEENVTALEIYNTIRSVAGIIINPSKPDPAALAAHFHGCLQLESRTPSGEPALRYFRDDFYVWNGQTWQRVDDKELKARVTRHIQQAFRIAITETLIVNVIANLKGQTLLNGGHFQIPFWIESESPLVTRTPPLVVFQNGVVDIDDGMPYEDGWSPPRLYLAPLLGAKRPDLRGSP